MRGYVLRVRVPEWTGRRWLMNLIINGPGDMSVLCGWISASKPDSRAQGLDRRGDKQISHPAPGGAHQSLLGARHVTKTCVGCFPTYQKGRNSSSGAIRSARSATKPGSESRRERQERRRIKTRERKKKGLSEREARLSLPSPWVFRAASLGLARGAWERLFCHPSFLPSLYPSFDSDRGPPARVRVGCWVREQGEGERERQETRDTREQVTERERGAGKYLHSRKRRWTPSGEMEGERAGVDLALRSHCPIQLRQVATPSPLPTQRGCAGPCQRGMAPWSPAFPRPVHISISGEERESWTNPFKNPGRPSWSTRSWRACLTDPPATNPFSSVSSFLLRGTSYRNIDLPHAPPLAALHPLACTKPTTIPRCQVGDGKILTAASSRSLKYHHFPFDPATTFSR